MPRSACPQGRESRDMGLYEGSGPKSYIERQEF